jgi:uncharacterized membrane protein
MAEKESDIPPGWDYNPATWGQRLPIIVLAIIGFFIAAYLTLYQLKFIKTVWEPFFGNGSIKILNSHISRILPVPDAGLGAFGYLVDAVAGIIGSTRRWHTMPWIVVVFGIAVGPLGLVSVLLVVLQPVMFDTWCTLCLVTAFISVVMIGPTMDELLASMQYLKRVKKAGLPVWKAFWGVKSITEKVK